MHTAGCAEAIAARNICSNSARGVRGGAALLMNARSAASLEDRLEQSAHVGGIARDLDAALLHDRQLLRRGSLSAGNDRARVAHAFPRRRGDAGNEADYRLLHVFLDPVRTSLFVVPADLADHDDRV